MIFSLVKSIQVFGRLTKGCFESEPSLGKGIASWLLLRRIRWMSSGLLSSFVSQTESTPGSAFFCYRRRTLFRSSYVCKQPGHECFSWPQCNICLFRYVLYGREGCGKSISLSHITHYGWQEGFIVITFPWVRRDSLIIILQPIPHHPLRLAGGVHRYHLPLGEQRDSLVI